MPRGGVDPKLRVLVVDDDPIWIKTLLAHFERRSVYCRGVSDPAEVLRWTAPESFLEFDMIFLDMRLGVGPGGDPITAADVLLHLTTYAPAAKVVIFTQREITVEECVRCIQLGALGIIPKTSDVDHYILVAEVYRNIGDEEKAREERIRSLWARLANERDRAKGRSLEMLMVNIFNSIDGFTAIAHNKMILAGEIDIVVENRGEHQFWRELESFHLVIECKNRIEVSEKEQFNVLVEKVRGKQSCSAGIFVSWTGVSRGFRDLQTSGKRDAKIFALNREQVADLIRRRPRDREDCLRKILSAQL